MLKAHSCPPQILQEILYPTHAYVGFLTIIFVEMLTKSKIRISNERF